MSVQPVNPAQGGKQLSWPVRLAWLVCAMPELVKSFAWDAFVLFYYAQVVGLRGEYIGIAIAVIILFDTIVDPWIGNFSDRLTHSRLGRRHTLMFAAIIPFMVGIACVFSPPTGMSQIEILAWLLGAGLLARGSISFWTVPAYALGGELTDDKTERRSVAVLRNVGNQLVILIVPAVAFGMFFVATPEFPKAQLNPAPYPGFGLFIALLAGALMTIGAAGTVKRARAVEAASHLPTPAPQVGLFALVRSLIAAIHVTPNIGRLLMVAFLVLFTNSVINQLSLHLATYFWQLDHNWTPRLLIAGVVGTLIAMPIAPVFVRAVGSRRAMIIGLSAFFLSQAATIMVPLAGLAPTAGSEAMGIFVSAMRGLGGLAYGLYVVPFNIMTYDIGDEHQANTGLPSQGLVASFMFIGLQLGSGAVALLAGSFLGLIDFPVGLPVESMPPGKVAELAWFVCALIIGAGLAMSWLVGRFKLPQMATPA